MRRRTQGSRAERYQSRLPRLAGWAFGTLAGLGLLVALAYVHGNGVSAEDDFLSSLHNTLTKPLVASTLAFAGLLAVTWSSRNLLLELMAWWPGRIVVEEFEASAEVDPAQLPRLTAEFRDRLARSHLQSPAPVPAPTQQGDFLDVLSSGGLDPGNLLTGLLGLLRVAVPTHAYAVKVALVTRDKPRGCGVTVQVVRLPGQGSRPRTFWDSDWEPAIRRSADHATASILPRTRLCSSPWSAWRGYRLPSDLLHAYERGAELEKQRRYDEALGHYYAAVREDPMNVALRLQIGFLQEKLALFLDALATYESILAVSRPGWRSRRDRDRVLLVARYRRAILLGGQELPRQWRHLPASSAPTRRDLQRRQLRERLRPALTELFREAGVSPVVRAVTQSTYAGLTPGREGARLDPPRAKLRRGLKPPPARDRHWAIEELLAEPAPQDDERRALELRELLALAALHELSRLRTELGRRRRTSGSLSRQALDLSGVWIQHNLRVLLSRLEGRRLADWMPTAEELEDSLGRIGGRRGFKRWQENYNAACVYSLPLLLDEGDRPSAEQNRALSHRAVKCLEEAIACVDSASVASRRDWVLSDDPDLDGLRAESSFKRYEAMFFPSAWRTPRRPRELHKWELSSYTFELLSTVAARWEQAWLRRKDALETHVGVSAPAGWCKVEREAWRCVRQVAVDNRHWETRAGLINQMERWRPAQGFDPLEVAFPCFAGSSEWTPEDDVTVEVNGIVERNDTRLEELARVLHQAGEQADSDSLLADLGDLNAELVRVDTSRWTVPRPEAARLCESHAALWRTLRRCLDGAEEAMAETLEPAIDETLGLWRDVRRRWQAAPGTAQAAA